MAWQADGVGASRTDRWLIIGVVVLAVALAAIVAAVILRSRAAPVNGPAAPLSQRGPILLVPGYGGGTEGVSAMADRLKAAGVPAEVISIGDGQGDLRGYADTVLARARTLVAEGAPSVDLVGFSAGGVIVRTVATDPAAETLVRRVVQVAAPNDGTSLAALGALAGECPTACQQIRPGSELLESLPAANSAERWLSLWSDTDEVIRPAESSVLAGATDVRMQSLCPGQVTHSGLITDPAAAAIAGSFLADGSIPATCPR